MKELLIDAIGAHTYMAKSAAVTFEKRGDGSWRTFSQCPDQTWIAYGHPKEMDDFKGGFSVTNPELALQFLTDETLTKSIKIVEHDDSIRLVGPHKAMLTGVNRAEAQYVFAFQDLQRVTNFKGAKFDVSVHIDDLDLAAFDTYTGYMSKFIGDIQFTVDNGDLMADIGSKSDNMHALKFRLAKLGGSSQNKVIRPRWRSSILSKLFRVSEDLTFELSDRGVARISWSTDFATYEYLLPGKLGQ